MARIQNKLIFTNEGNRLLVSQVGGIKFTILGGFLVQGKEPCVNPDDLKEKYLNLTLEELLEDNNVVIGMKDVTYLSQNNGKVIPKDETAYNNALKEIDKHLFGTYYIPSLEYKKNNHYFGTYDFDFDKTDLMIEWNQEDKSVSFSMFCIVGKQYAETNDATFNVNENQNPSIVAVAQVLGEYDEVTEIFYGGIQFPKEQNQYLSYKLRLVFSLTDDQEDSTASFELDEDVKSALENIQLINKGLKTNQLGITIDDNYIEDLRLNPNGSFATTKSLMVADKFYASAYENQFNAAGLVHLVNKKTDDKYMEQLIFTSIEEPSATTADLTAYNVGILLRGNGEYVEGYGSNGAGPYPFTPGSGSSGSSGHNIPDYHWSGYRAPSFTMNGIPEVDNDNLYTVDIFGIGNVFIGSGNADKSLFSQKNVYTNPVNVTAYGYEDESPDNGFNVTIQSNENIFCNANTNNTLLKSNGNYFGERCHSNIIFGGDKNLISGGANTNMLFASDMNYLGSDNTYGNILIGGHENILESTTGTMIIGGIGIKGFDNDDQLILGKYNANSTAKVIYGIGTSDNDRRNALEFYPDNGELRLFKNGAETVAIGGDYGIRTNSLTLDTISVQNEYVQNSLNVANSLNVGSSIETYAIKAANITATNILSANFITSPSNINVNNDAGIYGSLGINNNNSCALLLSDNTRYLVYNTLEGNLAIINNTPNQNNLTGYSTDNGMGATHSLNSPDLQSRVYLNKDVDANGTEYYSTGTVTVYVNKPNASDKKVKITPEGIEFSKHNGTAWEQTNFILAGSSAYSKIKADIYIWGTDITNWSYDIYNFKGTQSQYEWLTTIFKKTPILTYGFKPNDIPNATNAVVWVNNGVATELCYLGVDYDENVDTIIDQVRGLQYKCNFAEAGGTARTYVVYTQVNPDGVEPFDELEINLHIRSWGNGRPFSLNWVPLTTNYSYSPVIKINIISDVTENSKRIDFYTYLNKNWEETMVFGKLSKKPCSVYAGSDPYAPTLQCTVPHGMIVGGNLLVKSNNSPFLFGWDVLGG
jgi:hypothetical protein